jgi:hypothetical protein
MTLRDKFLNSPCEKGYINMNIYRAENNVKIADDYAIEFLNWYISKSSILDIKYIGKTSKELLEIYKKEL